ncbi:hypothetical protein EVAR_66027_1 [Eumeta japonica]|uniref:Uncharacterized protein n=1 Tax=Eumeta variegata TaxID=151549 RepID=A0A4C1Z3F2_EUMVA|nr:hypothetical protein EVAR_66027_1 [Eumeta japonica]
MTESGWIDKHYKQRTLTQVHIGSGPRKQSGWSRGSRNNNGVVKTKENGRRPPAALVALSSSSELLPKRRPRYSVSSASKSKQAREPQKLDDHRRPWTVATSEGPPMPCRPFESIGSETESSVPSPARAGRSLLTALAIFMGQCRVTCYNELSEFWSKQFPI